MRTRRRRNLACHLPSGLSPSVVEFHHINRLRFGLVSRSPTGRGLSPPVRNYTDPGTRASLSTRPADGSAHRCSRIGAGGAMHEVIESKRQEQEIAALCRAYGVRRLETFRSTVGPAFSATSDIDVLVDVVPERLTLHDYFAFRDALSGLLGRPADVVDGRAIKNPYFRAT